MYADNRGISFLAHFLSSCAALPTFIDHNDHQGAAQGLIHDPALCL
jgi:hypothetical protein